MLVFTEAQDIITDAYRECNIVPIGTDPTDNQNTEGLKRLNKYIKSVYSFELGEKLMDWMAPQPQRTAPLAANYPQAPYPLSVDANVMSFPYGTALDFNIFPYPPGNSRIIWGGGTLTVYFPENPENGARMAVVQGSGLGDSGHTGDVLTLDGNGRWIGAAGTAHTTFTFNATTPFAPAAWLYIAQIGTWVPMHDLALTDELPFPDDFDDLWIVALATRLAPRYNKKISAESQLIFKQTLFKLKAAYRQTAPTVYGSFDFPRSLQSYISGRWYW